MFGYLMIFVYFINLLILIYNFLNLSFLHLVLSNGFIFQKYLRAHGDTATEQAGMKIVIFGNIVILQVISLTLLFLYVSTDWVLLYF